MGSLNHQKVAMLFAVDLTCRTHTDAWGTRSLHV